MPVQVEDVKSYLPPKDGKMREVIVVKTDQNVDYVFDHDLLKGNILFSHRLYHDKPKDEAHEPANYRIPRNVEDAIRSKFGEYEYMDGMIDEAQQNHQTYVIFKENENIRVT